jgi:hypothetical protein
VFFQFQSAKLCKPVARQIGYSVGMSRESGYLRFGARIAVSKILKIIRNGAKQNPWRDVLGETRKWSIPSIFGLQEQNVVGFGDFGVYFGILQSKAM